MIKGHCGVLVALGASLLMQGCAMYSPERDKQGKAAKDAWAKVDLSQQTSVAEANLNKAFALQQSSVDEAAVVRRDALILALSTMRADATTNAMPQRPATLMTAISYVQAVGGISALAYPCKQMATSSFCSFAEAEPKWSQALIDERAAIDAYRNVQDYAGRFGVSWPASCSVLLNDTDKWKDVLSKSPGFSAVVGGFDAVKQHCQSLLNAQDVQLKLAPKSPWVEARTAAQTAREGFENQKKATAAARKDAVEAKKAIEAEESADTPNLENLKKASERLASAVKVLQGADDLFSLEFISAEKQDSLNAAFKAIADAKPGEDPSLDTGKSVSALILFADFFDSTSKKLKEDDEHSITGLVLEKKLAAVQQTAAQEAIKRLELGVQLKEQRADVLREQLQRYFAADSLLRTATSKQLSGAFLPVMLGSGSEQLSPQSNKASKLSKLQAELLPGDTENLWLGLGLYIDAATRLQALNEQLRYKQIALDRTEPLALAARNLASWKTLIDANVEQLATWAASGVKEEQVGALFDAIAKFAIAFGVNNK